MVKCPRCGTEIAASTREWDYNVFHVKRFDCKKCDKAFMAYYHGGKRARYSFANLLFLSNVRVRRKS